MAFNSSDSSLILLPFNTMIHMVTIKLSSFNYLLWKSKLFPFLESQGLLGHVDGTLVSPPHSTPLPPRHQATIIWHEKQLINTSSISFSPPS
jgi:hypothetical protein